MAVLPEVQDFLERFFGDGNLIELSEIDNPENERLSRLRPWVEFLRADPPQPTVLPRRRDAQTAQWYGLARSDRELRALGEEIQAFVGPTFASFRGERAPLDEADPVEAAVAVFTGGRAFRFSAPPSGAAQRALLRALELMRAVRVRRVERQLDVPRTTARALYDFRMALLAGNRGEAGAHLRYLRDGHRLDALNLLFLRVQMLAELGRWSELLEFPELPTLLQVRRPFAVTQALVGAVYNEEVAPRESLENPAAAAEHFAQSVFPRFASLYAVRAGMRTVEALKSFMLVAVATTPGDPRLRDEILATGGVPEADRAYLARLATLLPDVVAVSVEDSLQAAIAAAARGDLDAAFPLAMASPPTVERTRILLQCADEFQTLGAERQTSEAVLELTAEQRAQLFRIRRDRKVWERIAGGSADEAGATVAASVVPRGWIEWLTLVNAGESRSEWLREVARRGSAEWTIGAVLETPGGPARLAALLQSTRTVEAEAALSNSLPYLLGSLQQDNGWPRPELQESYEAVLALLVMQARGGEAELNLFLDLASAFLTLGLDRTRYEDLVQHAADLCRDFLAPRTVTWALDLLDILTAHPTASDEARLRLLVEVADRLQGPQISTRIKPVEVEFFGVLCRELGHPELHDSLVQIAYPAEGAAQVEADPYARLAGRTVAIYTLTESVAHRVRDVLLEWCGTVSVELCHEHVCTPRLKALAKEADFFLVATRSAKHPATECIEDNRGEGLPLLRPGGRGSASMLTELQAHLADAS